MKPTKNPRALGLLLGGSLITMGLLATGLMMSGACGGAQVAQASQPAPSFVAFDQNGETISLTSLRGAPVVLYFYPKDATPGCTTEACAFRDAWDRLQATGALVIGVSTDSVESHRAFAEDHELPFSLLSDEDGAIAASYGVPVRMGFAKRVTFVIDREGTIQRVFEDVDPAIHVDEVLEAIAAL